ncbi:MAG: hypothetical protein HYS43_01385 [Candidatus Liptonbacteria bacterium]|nr:hypothetical protein [Candidatus Liptonbacteria bacterium]
MNKFILSLLTAAFIAGTGLVGVRVADAATKSEPRSCEIKETLDAFTAIQDLSSQDAASGTDRQEQKQTAGAALLHEIVACSLDALDGMEKKLTALKGLSESEETHRTRFLKDIAAYRAYYEETAKTGDAAVQPNVKAVAQEILKWRQETYNPGTERIVNFVFLIEERNVIKTARARLDKIAAALKKVDLIQHASIRKLLEEARSKIVAAEALHVKAAGAFSADMERSQAPAGQATSTIAAIASRALPEFLNASSTDPAENGGACPAGICGAGPQPATTTAAITASTTNATATTSPKIAPVPEPSVKDMIDESFANVRGAYENFLHISRIVKQLIGL